MLHEIEEADLRDRIEQVVEEYPRYGYRRVTHHLRREGFKVNHKRVSRIMREESLQCQVKRHWVKTTDSDHPYRVYPNPYCAMYNLTQGRYVAPFVILTLQGLTLELKEGNNGRVHHGTTIQAGVFTIHL